LQDMGISPEFWTLGCPDCEKMKVVVWCCNKWFLYRSTWKMFIPDFPYTTPHQKIFTTCIRRSTCQKSHYCHTSSRSSTNV